MPSSVENRVVQMTFDNANFERKLDQTIQSIDKLEKSLEFEKSRKSLQTFASEVNHFNLGDIGTHIEGVSKKFLAMSTIALTALSNITSAAVRAGAGIAKSLSLDLVLDGFHEYETNINSIQTILANTQAKGSTLKDVTKALDTLNTYSDKTIYNFGQMTKNIGTFTAAGVDLDTSVQSIKGIANLAAISGSSADQAAGAMYQLSQAIATGSLKLQDWNSVVNAGLGGEVFQKSLFETGKTLGTLKNVPITQTFDQWKDAGNSFRGSLEDGWVTAKVLTTTLQNFTGEMTQAQLKAKGFTDQQIKEIDRLGKLGVDSATKVRTLTQLIGTVKEAVGSGWSASFRIVFGDFEEATNLFTDLSNAIGHFVSKNADARNAVLQGWKDLGGRKVLIEGLQNAFEALASTLTPITQAFRNIFPPITAKKLFELTQRFAEFTKSLIPTQDTMDKLRRIFMGFFSAIKIAMNIVGNVIKLVKNLFTAFAGDKDILGTIAKLGDFVKHLRDVLVEGKAIDTFFNKLTEAILHPQPYLEKLKALFIDTFENIKDTILNPIPFLEKLRDKIVQFLSKLTGGLSGLPGLEKLGTIDLPGAAPLENILDRLKTRFDQLKGAVDVFANVWDSVKTRFQGVSKVLQGIFDYIVTWFKELGQKLAKEMGPEDFNDAIDAVNVGLLGGIALLLKKFLSGGLKLDFGGGLMAKIAGAVDQLTGVLKAMQTNLKANALLKIAGAIAILTASLVVLSLIDSAALTKALTAMAVGFGQLMAVMALMNKMSTGISGSAGFTALATGLVLMSTAMLIFATAVKVFATMNWDDLSRGLAGISGGLAIMVGAVKLLGQSSLTTIAAALAMVEMATALTILGAAMKVFATMKWEDIGKGLTAISGGLLAMGLALSLVPASAPLVGAGFLILAAALNVLAGAMLIFATMKWGEIGKGLATIAGLLLIISAIMGNPELVTLPITAAGLLIASGAIVVLAGALKLFASIPGGDIVKGLAAMGGALAVLAIGVTAMILALPGAVALTIVTVALAGLAEVVEQFSKLKFGDLLKGLGGMAAVFLLLGLAAVAMAPILPELLGLGAAMLVVGAGFAAFGLGAILTAKAIQILAESGKAGMDAIFGFMDGLLERMPKLAVSVGVAILNIATTLIDGAVPLVKALGILLGHIIDKLTELLPKIADFIEKLIENVVKIINDKSADLIEAGLTLLTNLLKGIRDHIGEITTLAAEILVNFLKALKDKIPDIQAAGVDLIVTYIRGIGTNMAKIVAAGLDMLINFLSGLAKGIGRVVTAGADVVLSFIEGIGRNIKKIVDKGTDLLVQFLYGIGRDTRKIINAMGDLVVDILDAIGDAIDKYMPKIRAEGIRIVQALIDGMLFNLPSKLENIGKTIGKGIVDGAKSFLHIGSPSKVFMDIGRDVMLGFAMGIEDDTRMRTSVAAAAKRTTDAFNEAMRVLPDVLSNMDEFNPTITPVLDLSAIQQDSKQLSSFFATPNIQPMVDQANAISNATLTVKDPLEVASTQPTEIRFEQTINAPKQLSTADIYRQTRNQLVLAKEELKIP